MRIRIADGFKHAGETSERDRALGAAIGSGVSNLVTGTIASPFLFAEPGRRFSSKALRRAPVKHLRKIYGVGALGKGMALAGVSTLGGGIREATQAAFEKKRTKAASGDMLAHYQELAKRARGGDKAAILSLARRKRRERDKKADQGGVSVGHSGDLLRVSAPVSAPIGPETEPKDFMARRRTRRKKRVYADIQVGKTAAEEDAAEEKLGPVTLFSKKDSTEREQRERNSKRRKTARFLSKQSLLEYGRRRDAGEDVTYGQVDDELQAAKEASQVGIMAYQRDPGEIPESKRPAAQKGRVARIFGNRMSGSHALHRRSKKQEDEWMGENSEFVEVGRRPGLLEALTDVAGIEQDQVLSRSDVSKLVAERKQAKSSAYGRRREKGKAKEHVHTHSPDDLVELYRTFESLLENPAYKYFQVVG